MKRRIRKFRLSFLCLLLFLMSCIDAGIEQTLTLNKDESWQIEAAILFDPIFADNQETRSLIEQGLSEAFAEAEDYGISTDWRFEDDDEYFKAVVEASGDDLATLNRSFEGDVNVEKIELDGKEVFNVTMRPDFEFRPATYRLDAGGIVSSNGLEIESGILQWTNPGSTMMATVEGGSNFNFGLIAAPLALLAVGGGAYYVYNNRESLKSKMPSNIPVPSLAAKQLCQSCSQTIASGAPFCSHCGAKQIYALPQAETQACQSCQAVLPYGAAFCSECGATQAAPKAESQECPSCQAILQNGAVFCGECGAKVEINADSEAEIQT